METVKTVETVKTMETVETVETENLSITYLGTNGNTKTDVFSEKFQMPFDPPPPLVFGKLYCRFCDTNATKVRMFIMAGML